MLTVYFIILEILLYGSAVYLIAKKKELAILYLPVLFLIYSSLIDVPILRALFWYLLVTSIFAYAAYKSLNYRTKNIYAYLFILLFTFLYFFNSPSIVETRPQYFSMVWLAMALLIIPELYIRYEKEKILKELNKMCLIVLVLFIVNSLFSTLIGYYPNPMYGMISGLSYGGMFAAGFNFIPIILFAFLLFNIKKLSYINLIIAFTSFSLLMLTMRRSVIFVATIGICIIILFLLHHKNTQKIVIFLSVIIITTFTLSLMEVPDLFFDRFGTRFQSRDVVSLEEGRFIDHTLIYEDLFVYERYDKFFGYEFFNAPGNYGAGVLGDRNLHADIPLIVHASGIVGLILYLLMIIKSFKHSWRTCSTYMDKYIFVFCVSAFIVFTVTGRITNTAYAISLFLVLMIPVANSGDHEKNNRFVLR